MKKFFLTLIMTLCAFALVQAQNSYEEIYTRLSREANAERVDVGNFLMKLAVALSDDEETRFMKDIRSISVLSLESCNEQVKDAFRTAVGKSPETGLKLLTEVSDESKNLRVLAKMNKKYISQLVIVSTGDEPCLITIRGKIELTDVRKLVSTNIEKS